MAVVLAPVGDARPQFFTDLGEVLNGGLIYFYAAGTMTPQNTYTDYSGNSANSNPVELDADGRAPNGIWFTQGLAYKIIAKTASGTTLWTEDYVRGLNDVSVTQDQWIASGLTPTYVSATSFTLAGDQTTEFHEGRRLRITDGASTKYGVITGSSYSVPNTTVTVAGDALVNPTTDVSYGMLSAANPSISSEAIYRKGAAVASAATCDIWNTQGDFLHVTGTTDITSFGTAPYAGARKEIIFDGALKLTHNGTTLLLPGGVNIFTAANDRAIVRADTAANMVVIDYQRASGQPAIGTALPRMYISGLTYANNSGDATNDLDIAAGEATDATGARLLKLSSAITKQSDAAWAVGTNAGSLDTGVVGNSDYYLWLIARSDTGVVDVLSSLSATAPTMPANYDYKRLIGWFKRVGGTIVAFHTYETEGGGLELNWDAPTLDINLSNTLTTTRRTDAVKVPLNFSVIANLNVVLTDASSGHQDIVYNPDMTDAAPSATVAPLASQSTDTTASAMNIKVRTSATGTIAARSTLATVDLYAVTTLGFTWARRNS